MISAATIAALALFGLSPAGPASAATWSGSITLTASRSTVDVNDNRVTLTATASSNVTWSYYIAIYDDRGRLVGGCGQACTWSVNAVAVSDANTARTYTAYVTADRPNPGPPTSDVRAVSNSVTVTNVGWHGGVQLSRRYMTSQNWVKLEATATSMVRTPYILSIYDDLGRLVRKCPSYACSGLYHDVYSPGSAGRVYTAYAAATAPADHVPTEDVRAVSGPLAAFGNGPMAAGEMDGGCNPSVPMSQSCYGDPVNSVSGEFFEHNTDLAVPGASLQRNFSTARRSIDGVLGYGWSSNIDTSLTGVGGSPVATASEVVFRQENGSVVVFRRGADGRYTVPARVMAQLVANPDGTFTATRRQDQVFTFSAQGKLLREQDRNGQGRTLEPAPVSRTPAVR